MYAAISNYSFSNSSHLYMALLKSYSLFLLGDVVSLLELVHVKKKIHLGGCMISSKLLVSSEGV